jgi:hypothetical protein
MGAAVEGEGHTFCFRHTRWCRGWSASHRGAPDHHMKALSDLWRHDQSTHGRGGRHDGHELGAQQAACPDLVCNTKPSVYEYPSLTTLRKASLARGGSDPLTGAAGDMTATSWGPRRWLQTKMRVCGRSTPNAPSMHSDGQSFRVMCGRLPSCGGGAQTGRLGADVAGGKVADSVC